MKRKKEDEKMVRLNKCILVITLIIIFSVISLVYASTFIDKSQSNFDLGTYNNTLYNASVGAGVVQINLSYNNGTYTSQIFNTGSNVSLNNLSWTYQRIQCPQNMSFINKLNGYCIDQYEASMPSATSTLMGNDADIANRDAPGTMQAISQPGVIPWVSVSANSARIACTNAGKHLCTDEEWLAAANINGQVYYLPTDLSASPNFCNTNSACSGSYAGGAACDTGNKTNCKSAEGVYDMVGNVWEWTNNTVDVTNPGSGANWYYFNGAGWQTGTDATTLKYGNDGVYFPADSLGMAVIRGGGWYDGAIVGPFCAGLYDAPSRTSYGVGFRCCSS